MIIDDTLLLLGIRHHGPGSAASTLRALEVFAADVLLIEGPPEAEPLLAHVADPSLKPPVAQLIYAKDDHRDSAFYPYTEFSPEWQAMLFAHQQGIAVCYIDLPLSHSLALSRQQREQPADDDKTIDSLELPQDPLDSLAYAAGFSDGERWWEHVVEQHQHDIEVFAVLADAMSAVREPLEAEQGISQREQLREAWMRKQIRLAKKDGFEKIAVVCGAWHVPALSKPVKIKDDNALLKGLPKIKLTATWIPWSYGRISYRSGYGAGVTAPGWYHHLWQYFKHADRAESLPNPVIAWLTIAARMLREQGYDVAPSSVIDAVRLAETLAAIRNSPKPSLEDMNETIQTLYCFGQSSPMVLLNKTLMIGERLGQVPDNLPKAPLQQDLDKQAKRLRIKVSAIEATLTLDLRKDNGKERSALFNRLILLGVKWAECVSSGSGKGTFKEIWQLQWQPEFELDLIEKSAWGNTIGTAASRLALDSITKADKLDQLCEWLNKLLLADLTDAIPAAIKHLNDKAALTTHTDELMQALPALVRVVRYGDVRNTDTGALQHVIDSFVTRICIGLVKLCRQLDHDGAQPVAGLFNGVTEALNILQIPAHVTQWFDALARLTDSDNIHGLLAGRGYRLQLNADKINPQAAATAFAFALSQAEEPQHAADWIEGLLDGAGLMLIHDDRIWSVLDVYLCQLNEARFELLLPLLRRTFASFELAERQNLLQKAAAEAVVGASLVAESEDGVFDRDLAGQSLPLVGRILGL